jgi:hypothetical protein
MIDLTFGQWYALISVFLLAVVAYFVGKCNPPKHPIGEDCEAR